MTALLVTSEFEAQVAEGGIVEGVARGEMDKASVGTWVKRVNPVNWGNVEVEKVEKVEGVGGPNGEIGADRPDGQDGKDGKEGTADRRGGSGGRGSDGGAGGLQGDCNPPSVVHRGDTGSRACQKLQHSLPQLFHESLAE
ncbi:hypothetical protein B0H10DRAFT_1952324 [Mycena sp. CBHHK59/15]|nr:hypothetical protein B0H10DRAFT_1952324 [Mycena sp. CBHHK59/15]